MARIRLFVTVALAAGIVSGACRGPATSPAPETGLARGAVPVGRLPSDVRPIRYQLVLEIEPAREYFSGTATIEIELDRSLSTIWLHGLGLEVGEATVTPAFAGPITARWELANAAGVAALRLPRPVGPGTATLRIAYRAPFDRRLRGLYRVEVGDDAYAFTQFEPTKARRAFPGFDEPAFKTPFDVTLIVPDGQVAVANTPPAEETQLPDGRRRVRFERTKPLPTYLLAWGVGPFDVVNGPTMGAVGPRTRALPFRGIATRGRGTELTYALEHTPALLESLEAYFETEYPYAKLDVISVPDFGSGAMENAGAITFRDTLLLLDEVAAPEWQRRAFTYVMAHELAHQWFGNLVTMTWWDDLWLNEAFATWMGRRVVQRVAPDQMSELALLENIHQAMQADSLVSARSVRRSIQSHHDIVNAFDSITYSKGAGVLAMFEHWLGEKSFQRGIRLYLDRHRFGSATGDDFMSALSEISQRDVASAFRSFLMQPGVPFLEVASECRDGRSQLHIRQSRYLPIGSSGSRDATWQVPFCARYGVEGGWRETCHLVESPEDDVALEGGCPSWIMPNASAAGYYRWTLAPEDSRRLLEHGWPQLSDPERLSVAMNLEAGFRAGTLSASEVFAGLAPLAMDDNRLVAEASMALLNLAREKLATTPAERAAVESFARELYLPRYRELGWDVVPGESGETRLLRRSLIHFLAFTARDQEVRREALRRGRVHLGLTAAGSDPPLDAELIDTVLAVAVQDGPVAVFDALHRRLDGERDAIERARILRALGAALTPSTAERARALALDPRLRVNEIYTPLWSQASQPETRHQNWSWIERHFEALIERSGPSGSRRLPWMAAGFCSEEDARAVADFAEDKIDAIDGGPRNLAGALEAIRLCAALVDYQRDSVRRFFRE